MDFLIIQSRFPLNHCFLFLFFAVPQGRCVCALPLSDPSLLQVCALGVGLHLSYPFLCGFLFVLQKLFTQLSVLFQEGFLCCRHRFDVFTGGGEFMLFINKKLLFIPTQPSGTTSVLSFILYSYFYQCSLFVYVDSSYCLISFHFRLKDSL